MANDPREARQRLELLLAAAGEASTIGDVLTADLAAVLNAFDEGRPRLTVFNPNDEFETAARLRLETAVDQVVRLSRIAQRGGQLQDDVFLVNAKAGEELRNAWGARISLLAQRDEEAQERDDDALFDVLRIAHDTQGLLVTLSGATSSSFRLVVPRELELDKVLADVCHVAPAMLRYDEAMMEGDRVPLSASEPVRAFLERYRPHLRNISVALPGWSEVPSAE